MLQETHSILEDEHKWQKEWGGKMWLCHGSSQSKGVAVLLNKSSSLEIIQVTQALEGRFIMVEVSIEESNFIIANLYAPNEDNAEFFVKAFEIIDRKENPNMMMVGDFNTALDPIKDSRCVTDQHKNKRAAILSYMEKNNLVDVWRNKNPDKFQYSWKRDRLALVLSRIDYFLVSESLCNRVIKAEMQPGYKSDHWRLDFHFDFETCPRGKGFWKLNVQHLKSTEFLEGLNQIVDQFLWEVKENISPAQEWEYLKLRITSYATEYSARKAMEKNRLIEKFEKRIIILDEQLLKSDNLEKKNEIAQKIRKTEEFLINEHEQRINKYKIFAKKRRYNESERNSKYFFNIAKARYNAKKITRLKATDGGIVNSQKDILQELHKFYDAAFKDSKKNRAFIYTNHDGPRLNEEEKESLERAISMNEIAEAIKTMNDEKTPGVDGLPVEFYKVYWSRIKFILFRTLNFALPEGHLHCSANRGILTLLPKKDRDWLLLKSW